VITEGVPFVRDDIVEAKSSLGWPTVFVEEGFFKISFPIRDDSVTHCTNSRVYDVHGRMPEPGAVSVGNKNKVGTLVWVWEDSVEQLLIDSQVSVLAEHDGALWSKTVSNLLNGGEGGVCFAGDEEGFDKWLLRTTFIGVFRQGGRRCFLIDPGWQPEAAALVEDQVRDWVRFVAGKSRFKPRRLGCAPISLDNDLFSLRASGDCHVLEHEDDFMV